MADKIPLKLVDVGSGAGELREFAAGDTIPNVNLSANLNSFGNLVGVADRLPYFTGEGALSLTTLTAFARTLLDDADAAAMRSTLGLVKQTSATDTTAGAMLAVGSFGLGSVAASEPLLADFATITPSGFYRGLGQGAPGATLNAPPGSANSQLGIVCVRILSNTCYFYVTENGGSALSRKVWFGQNNSGVVTWQRMYSDKNILGTVSQSDGIPTGAIIERGSNANGEYVRYADGTQICTNSSFAFTDRTTGNGALFKTAELSWTFPATFTTSPVCGGKPRTGAVSANAWYGLGTGGDGATSSMSFAIHGTTSVAGSGTAMLLAIGRWF